MKFDEGGKTDDADSPYMNQVLDALWFVRGTVFKVNEAGAGVVDDRFRNPDNVQTGDGAAEDHHQDCEADHKFSHTLAIGEF